MQQVYFRNSIIISPMYCLIYHQPGSEFPQTVLFTAVALPGNTSLAADSLVVTRRPKATVSFIRSVISPYLFRALSRSSFRIS